MLKAFLFLLYLFSPNLVALNLGRAITSPNTTFNKCLSAPRTSATADAKLLYCSKAKSLFSVYCMGQILF